ncbi:erythromycin biosynthesis sensory transduction protein eryC1 [filamentous cyanobacterium CCP5]|nr:erythromycin biosynthesis sensory transduction protein eryC1 [filamentous cyanobacterium CCP5]
MIQPPNPIPFVDLSAPHQALKSDILAVVESLLDQGDFVLGAAVGEFEAEFAAACGACLAVGVGCGTDAIALGLTAAGIGIGDEVILPANTFVATLIGVLRSGATPVLVDCQPDTALIDLEAATAAITPRTRAILPVHLYGQMVSPLALKHLARVHNLLIFEDAAQAHLAKREGYRAGAVGIGAAFSFYPSKNLGAIGDGGMVTAANEPMAQALRALRNYGASQKYYHTHFQGTNSRLDTLQAAVLRLKLPLLQAWNQRRNLIAQYYDQRLAALASYGLRPMHNQSGAGHTYHLYVIQLTADCPCDRDQLQQGLAQAGIQTGIHYPLPCHLQPAFQSLGYRAGQFPVAERLSQNILSLPMYPNLETAQVDRVVEELKRLLVAAASSAQFAL